MQKQLPLRVGFPEGITAACLTRNPGWVPIVTADAGGFACGRVVGLVEYCDEAKDMAHAANCHGELLAALKSLLDDYLTGVTANEFLNPRESVKQAREAIAKAEGRGA